MIRDSGNPCSDPACRVGAIRIEMRNPLALNVPWLVEEQLHPLNQTNVLPGEAGKCSISRERHFRCGTPFTDALQRIEISVDARYGHVRCNLTRL